MASRKQKKPTAKDEKAEEKDVFRAHFERHYRPLEDVPAEVNNIEDATKPPVDSEDGLSQWEGFSSDDSKSSVEVIQFKGIDADKISKNNAGSKLYMVGR